MALEQFANNPATTVLSGGTSAPAAGTQETWTVESSTPFPSASVAASPPTQFHIADEALTGEIMAVTNVSGNNWTVIRGAEGTAPAAHESGFTVTQVVTAGGFDGFVQTSQMSDAIATETDRAENQETYLYDLVTNTAAGLLPLPSGTAEVGQVPTVTQASPLELDWSTPATGGGDVTSVFGRTGAVTAEAGDYTAEQVTGAVQLGGDIGGTVTAPEVIKIQGTAVAAPSGSGTQYLDATGNWSTPAGTGGSMSNPMTTSGDTIYGGTSGAPQRLAGNTAASRKFLTGTGTGTAANAPAWNTVQVSDVPTLNQSTTGTASNVTGTVAVANGGTGQTSAQAAMNALAGGVTSGRYLRGNGTNVALSAISAADLPSATTSAEGVIQLAGDLGGTGASPEVLKIQGTAIAAPTGSVTAFLNAAGQWAVPAGGGGGVVQATAIEPSGTDDTAAINAALSTAGGAALLQQATYYISAPLTPASGTALIGIQGGWASPQDAYGSENANNASGFPTGTVIQVLSSFVGESAILIDNEDTTNNVLWIGPLLRDLYLDCRSMPAQTANWSVSTKAYNGNGISIYGAFVAGQMERVTVLRPQGSCFVFDNAASASGSGYPDNWVIRACKASGARGGASSVANGYGGYGFCLIRVPDVVFADCESSENGTDNWYINDVVNGMFSNCKGENSYAGNGWHFIGAYGAGYYQNFVGCTSNYNAQNGFLWDETSGGSGPADWNMVGCKATNDGQSGSGYGGFVANGSPDRIMLTGCFTDGNTQTYGISATNSYGIWVTGGNFAGTAAGFVATYDGGGNTNGIVESSAPGLPLTGGTVTGDVTITSGAGTGAALTVNNSATGTYVSAFDALAPNVTDGDYVLFHVGQDSVGDSAEFAYIAGSPRNFLFGFQGGPQAAGYDDTGKFWTGTYAGQRNMLDDGSGNMVLRGSLTLQGSTTVQQPTGSTTQYLNGAGGWTTPAGGSGMTNPMTTAGDTIYGGTSGAPQRLAGNTSATKMFKTQTGTGTASAAPAWGTIQAADIPTLNQSTTGTASNVTGTVALAHGGTGATSAQAAMNALAGAVTSASYLRGNGTNVALSAIQASDVPTLNQSTTGNAATATNFASGATLPGYVAPHAIALTFGTTIAVNAALGNAYNLTLTASTGTISNPTNPVDGQVIRFRISQDATGSRTVAWGTAYDFGAAGTAPTLSATASKTDIIAFEYIASLSKWACLNSGGLGY